MAFAATNPFLTNSASEPSFQLESEMLSRKAIIINSTDFVQSLVKDKVKSIEIYDHQDVILVKETGEKIQIPAELTHLPVCNRLQLEAYLKHSFIKISQFDDGQYNLHPIVRGLGGGHGSSKEAPTNNPTNGLTPEEEKRIKAITGGKGVNGYVGFYNTYLNQACSKNKTSDALLLIKAGANVNAVNNSENTCLSQALREFKKDGDQVILALIRAGANVNAKDDSYYGTCVHTAFGSCDAPVISAVIQAGAELHSVNKNDHTPLRYAFNNKLLDSNFICSLLQQIKSIPPKDLNYLLHEACKRGHSELVQGLLRFVDDPEIIDFKNLNQYSSQIKEMIYGVLGTLANEKIERIVNKILRDLKIEQLISNKQAERYQPLIAVALSASGALLDLLKDIPANISARNALAETIKKEIVRYLKVALSDKEIQGGLQDIILDWKAVYVVDSADSSASSSQSSTQPAKQQTSSQSSSASSPSVPKTSTVASPPAPRTSTVFHPVAPSPVSISPVPRHQNSALTINNATNILNAFAAVEQGFAADLNALGNL